jgi:hypothetical protein
VYQFSAYTEVDADEQMIADDFFIFDTVDTQ